ncbi:MAG: hypothetical protein AAF909_15840, partial [Pseudomonadota bacterium]
WDEGAMAPPIPFVLETEAWKTCLKQEPENVAACWLRGETGSRTYRFSAWLYSFDVFLPVLTIEQEAAWNPVLGAGPRLVEWGPDYAASIWWWVLGGEAATHADEPGTAPQDAQPRIAPQEAAAENADAPGPIYPRPPASDQIRSWGDWFASWASWSPLNSCVSLGDAAYAFRIFHELMGYVLSGFLVAGAARLVREARS